MMTHKILAAFTGFVVFFATVQSFAANKFEDAEYFQSTFNGQKKDAPAVKGTLFFNSERKSVEFLDKSGSATSSVSYESIKAMLYEKTSKPRYTAAVLVSPMFLLSHAKKHYLTFQYTGADGNGQYMIIHLDKKNAREAVATAEAETGKKVERAEEK
jgi:hypothetical protein